MLALEARFVIVLLALIVHQVQLVDQALLLEHLEGAIHSDLIDLGVFLGGQFIDLVRVQMRARVMDQAEDQFPLARQPQAPTTQHLERVRFELLRGHRHQSSILSGRANPRGRSLGRLRARLEEPPAFDVGPWRSLVARFLGVEEVPSSNLGGPTNRRNASGCGGVGLNRSQAVRSVRAAPDCFGLHAHAAQSRQLRPCDGWGKAGFRPHRTDLAPDGGNISAVLGNESPGSVFWEGLRHHSQENQWTKG